MALISSSALNAAAGACLTVATFVVSIIVARCFDRHDAGTIFYIYALATILNGFLDFALPLAVSRFIPEKLAESAPAAGRFGALLLRLVMAVAVFSIVIALALDFVGRRLGVLPPPLDQPGLVTLAGCLFALQMWANFGSAYRRGIGDYRRLLIASAVSAALLLICVGAAGLAGNIYAVIASYSMLYVAPMLLTVPLISHLREATYLPDERVRRFLLSTWIATFISTVVWTRLDLLFLNSYWGAAATASYAIGLTLAGAFLQLPTLLAGALIPHFARVYAASGHEAARDAYRDCVRMVALLAFPLCFGGAAVIPIMLPLVYGAKFAGSIPATQILVATSAFGAIGVVGAAVLYSRDRANAITATGVVGAVLFVAAGFLIVPIYGLLGAAVSRGFLQFGLVAAGFCYIHLVLRYNFPVIAVLLTAIAAEIASALAYALIVAVPSLPGAVAAAIVGFVSYAVSVRFLGLLPPSDAQRFRRVTDRLPTPLANIFSIALALLSGKFFDKSSFSLQ